MALQLGKKFPLIKRKQIAHKRVARDRRKTLIRSTTKGIIVLAILAIGAGALYTWYSGQQENSSAIATPVDPKPRPEFKKPKVVQNARVGIATQTITSPVNPGTNASITIRTNPEATCTIKVVYNNIPSKDGGLTKKVADDFGVLSWAWTVEASAPEGTWPVTVTCANKKYSAVVVADLVVKVAK